MEVSTTRRSDPPKKGNNGNRDSGKRKRVTDAYLAIINEKGEAPTITHLANLTGVSRKTVGKYIREL